jgi:ATP-dependent DNA helicase RecG
MTLADIEALREGWDFEAKLARGRDGRGAVPESFWETYSAMANTEGGSILLGAKEREDLSLEFRGVVDVEKLERDLWNMLENREKVSVNLLRRTDVAHLEVDGRSLLLIRVPKAGRADRPVFLKGSLERGTYLRVHEGDHRIDADKARRMYADRVKDRDSGVLDDYSLSDLSSESVRRYRTPFFSEAARIS